MTRDVDCSPVMGRLVRSLIFHLERKQCLFVGREFDQLKVEAIIAQLADAIASIEVSNSCGIGSGVSWLKSPMGSGSWGSGGGGGDQRETAYLRTQPEGNAIDGTVTPKGCACPLAPEDDVVPRRYEPTNHQENDHQQRQFHVISLPLPRYCWILPS